MSTKKRKISHSSDEYMRMSKAIMTPRQLSSAASGAAGELNKLRRAIRELRAADSGAWLCTADGCANPNAQTNMQHAINRVYELAGINPERIVVTQCVNPARSVTSKPTAKSTTKIPNGKRHAMAEELFECENCGEQWEEDELDDIDRLHERVAGGELMPDGQCPDSTCGALCHRVVKA